MAKGQLSLFGGPPPGVVGPAEVPAEIAALARELPADVRLGTSSWSFPGWQGIVYDRAVTAGRLARHGLTAYASHPLLRAVGIDRTYYAPLTAAEFAAYAADVPESFRFLVKGAGQCTTPYRRAEGGGAFEANELFLDGGFANDQVVGPFVEGLGARAGPLVFQFPPLGARIRKEPARFAERLGTFLEALPRGPLYAVELRDRELFGDEYVAALRAAGARHCLNVHPRMPPVAEQRQRTAALGDGPLVVRWMLHSGLEYEQAVERYEPFSRLVDEDPDSRVALAELCVSQIVRRQPVVIVANNKAEGSAPLTICKLAGSIVERLRDRRTVGE